MTDLPHNWTAYPHQRALFDHMFEGQQWPYKKRAVEVWHRRAGKDSSGLNLMAMASQMRVGTYWHMLPTLRQGRKVVWKGINRQGERMIDQAFPKEMRHAINETDMSIEFKNGSIWQVMGSDSYDSYIGTNPIGVIMSEYSVADPAAWNFIRPILRENGGFVIFIYTPRGKNHGHRLFEIARKRQRETSLWRAALYTCRDTKRDDGSPIISDQDIEDERSEGMEEDMIQQEYFVSFDTGLAGAYWAALMNEAEQEGRVGDFPYVPGTMVNTYWDLGQHDDNFIIFAQPDPFDDGMLRVVDTMWGGGVGMRGWIKKCRSAPYLYDRHFAPHDIKHKDYSAEESEEGRSKTRKEVAYDIGWDFEDVPKVALQDGIDAVRNFFWKLKFNNGAVRRDDGSIVQDATQRLRDSISSYQREYDEDKQMFVEKPLHNWACHGADAMRYFSLSWDQIPSSRIIVPATRAVRPRRAPPQRQVKRAYGGRVHG